MKTCNCSTIKNTFCIQSPREAFVKNFTVIERSDKEWVELCKCDTCDQIWIVEFGAEMDRRSNFAVKTNSESLTNFDFSSFRVNIDIEKHGGVSDAICIFAGCTSYALKGIVFCSTHKL